MKEPALSGSVIKLFSLRSKASFCNKVSIFKFSLEGRDLKATKDYS